MWVPQSFTFLVKDADFSSLGFSCQSMIVLTDAGVALFYASVAQLAAELPDVNAVLRSFSRT